MGIKNNAKNDLVHEMELIHDLTSLMKAESHTKCHFQLLQDLLLIIGGNPSLLLRGPVNHVCRCSNSHCFIVCVGVC